MKRSFAMRLMSIHSMYYATECEQENPLTIQYLCDVLQGKHRELRGGLREGNQHLVPKPSEIGDTLTAHSVLDDGALLRLGLGAIDVGRDKDLVDCVQHAQELHVMRVRTRRGVAPYQQEARPAGAAQRSR
jgi:hypothetical protein